MEILNSLVYSLIFYRFFHIIFRLSLSPYLNIVDWIILHSVKSPYENGE